MYRYPAITCAAVLALVAGQAVAQGQVDNDAPTAAVSYADLDLSHASGRTVLEHRIEAAIDRVCPGRPGPADLRNLSIGRKCREQAWAGAQRQLAVIYDDRSLAAAAILIGPGKH